MNFLNTYRASFSASFLTKNFFLRFIEFFACIYRAAFIRVPHIIVGVT